MPHSPVTIVILRPLDELGPQVPRTTRSAQRRAQRAASGPALGPRGVLEMLDLSLEHLREHFALMVGFGALAWLPVRALTPFIGAHVWQSSMGTDGMLGPGLATMAMAGGAAMAQCCGSALLARIVHDSLAGRELALGATLRAVLGRIHVVLVLALLMATLLALGMCACFVPWVLLSWKLSVAPMACVIEGSGVGASMSRSFALTRRGFGRWLFLWLSVVAIGLPFTGITALADQPQIRAQTLAWSGLSATSFDLGLVLLSSLMLGVSIALQSSVFTVYYADCCVRREGSDLELQRARLARAVPA